MAGTARSGALILAVATAAVWLPVASAQNAPESADAAAFATLPESNEALLITGQIDGALKTGDYRLALELVERLKDISGGVVASPASRTYYPVWRQVFRVMDRFPEPAAELFRRLNDPEITTRFADAAAAGDIGALRRLFRDSRLSSIWRDIGVELASRLLDNGLYGEAIETLLELQHARDKATPETRAQLVAALGSAGAVARAEKLLGALLSTPEAAQDENLRERLHAIEGWLSRLSGQTASSSATAKSDPGEFRPVLRAGAIWAQSLTPDGVASPDDQGEELARAIGALQSLPVLTARLADEALAFRLGTRLYVYDVRTLAPRWDATLISIDEPSPQATEFPMEMEPRDGSHISAGAESLLRDYLRHAVAVEFGLVLTVEGGARSPADLAGLFPQRGGLAQGVVQRNELVARDLCDGRVVWRTGGDPSSGLYDVVFQNVPIAIGSELVAPVQRDEGLNLVALDPSNGELTREIPIVGPPTHFTLAGGRCLLASDETSVYVCTGNGVVAALGREDLSWKWATAYPSTLARLLGQLWWQPAQAPDDASIDQPVVIDDLLIIAPLDSNQIIALDRFDGEQRWSLPRSDYPYLIGAVRRGLVVGGQSLVCLDASDPRRREPLWRTVPLEITGRSAIRDNAVFTPTREGVVMIDGDSGKVVSDQSSLCAHGDKVSGAVASPDDAPDVSANLLASSDALFSITSGRIVKYPDPALARLHRNAATADDGSSQAEVALEDAWLDVFEGDYPAALAGLSECRPTDAPVIAARDQLLTRVYVGLAQSAAAGDDRLAWLRKAAGVAGSDGAASLAVAIGRTLEQAGRWDDAVRHYGDMLFQEHVAPAFDPQDSDRRVAQWLLAARRIRELSDKAPESLQRLLSTATASPHDSFEPAAAPVGSGDQTATRLERLHVALAAGPLEKKVGRLLCTSDLPPEIKLRYLPATDDAPPIDQRRLLLERWDVHASLGMLEAAAEDEKQWRDLNVASLSPTGDQPPASQRVMTVEEQAERVDSIELALRKQAQACGEPFTKSIIRQWKAEHAELIRDPRFAPDDGGQWLLAADLDRRQIQLINSYARQQAQRQTEDFLVNATVPRAPQPGSPRGAGPRGFWPAAIDGHLAAIPVPGGLVCVGTGPERYAGRRQWEYPVPDWDDIPPAFIAHSATGSRGVYFTPRSDRVAMVGWSDGELWWRRDLPGVTIDQLHLVKRGDESDEQLVVVSDDRRVWVIDALDGQGIQRVDIGTASPRRIDVAGDRIVVWGPDFVAGVDARTLERVWTRSTRPVVDTFVAPARQWIAYRAAENESWSLLNATTGELVSEKPIGSFAGLSAIADDGEFVLVAGFVSTLDTDSERFITRLTALSRDKFTPLWTRDLETEAPINASQLTAHKLYIPILLTPTAQPAPGAPDNELPAIVLVDKHTGTPGEPVSIKRDFRAGTDAVCEMSLIATSSRIIVQAGGNLIAYGQSSLHGNP